MKSLSAPDLEDLSLLIEIIAERGDAVRPFFDQRKDDLIAEWKNYLETNCDVSRLRPDISHWIERRATLVNLYSNPSGTHERYLKDIRNRIDFNVCVFCARPLYGLVQTCLYNT